MEEEYIKKIMSALVLFILIVLSFFLLRPILLSIILGIILAFIFNPLYKIIHKKTKSKNLSAFIVCSILVVLIILPIWFLTPIVIDQSIRVYQVSQQVNFVEPLKSIFPSIFASEEFSSEIGSAIRAFVANTANKLVNALGDMILNFPTLFLQFIVVCFTLFFILRDKEELGFYITSLSPFSKDVEKKFLESSRAITASVIYGQVVIGILQGAIAGLGFFIFLVPNALLLTLLACLAGIFPIIGTTIVWAPVVIYLFIGGNTFAAIGVIFFGTIAATIDNFLRPIIVSKRTHIHSSVLLVGMIGGLFLFGVLGFILGPLILAYLLILLDIYRNKNVPGIFTSKPSS